MAEEIKRKNEPLEAGELKAGEYYECILTEQRILILRVETTGEVLARYYNRVSGLYEDFWVGDNQLRKWN